MDDSLQRLSEERLREIADEVQKQQPLTSERYPLSKLEQQYITPEGTRHDNTDATNTTTRITTAKNSSTDEGGSHHCHSFRSGVQSLTPTYCGIRLIRGDGNCYYRAFLFSLTESILQMQQKQQAATNPKSEITNTNSASEAERILYFVKTISWENVKKAGYSEITIEVFYEEIVQLLENAARGVIDVEQLQSTLNEENSVSDYCTWYLRVVTATYLKLDPDRFLPFLEQYYDIQQFCEREVEPMGKECEQVQVLALAEAFGVRVHVEYLDGHDLVTGKLACHVFGPEMAQTTLYLLYRPGHYDILYRK